jgi:hypothetical protein
MTKDISFSTVLNRRLRCGVIESHCRSSSCASRHCAEQAGRPSGFISQSIRSVTAVRAISTGRKRSSLPDGVHSVRPGPRTPVSFFFMFQKPFLAIGIYFFCPLPVAWFFFFAGTYAIETDPNHISFFSLLPV